MKLSLLLVFALLALSSASSLDTGNTEDRNGDPELTAVAKLRQKRQVQSSSIASHDGSNLQWVTWDNSLPNDAVSIYNDYADRIDYICKHKCEAGFYTPSEGPYCHYANKTKTYRGSPFEILVNKDNFEILEWKDDSYGSVPKDSVRTCPGEDTYVGMNKYGLGKVSTKEKVFYLPWKGSEYNYKSYQVLTTNENIISQKIYNVKYNTDESKIIQYPPETMHETAISNSECHPVLKRDSLSKTYQEENRWNTGFSIKAGVETTIIASTPLIFSRGIDFGAEKTLQFFGGHTVVDTITDTVSLDLTAPPNHHCVVKMVQYKQKVDIPFTAHLSRTYSNGEVHTTLITGTYDSIRVREVRAVVDRCEPLDAKPCKAPNDI
uniref:Uncharacterized protein n=1 Tax=Lates calcarifer TaxID=8187 RepID=A0A4W6CRV8_LATCA